MRIKDNAKGLGHIGIPTSDLSASVSFYESLGFDLVHTSKTPDGVNVAFLSQKGLTVEIYESDECAQKNGAIDHIAISVADIDDAFEQMKLKHMKMLDETVQYLPFFEKGVRFFTIEGPNAEKVEFCQRI